MSTQLADPTTVCATADPATLLGFLGGAGLTVMPIEHPDVLRLDDDLRTVVGSLRYTWSAFSTACQIASPGLWVLVYTLSGRRDGHDPQPEVASAVFNLMAIAGFRRFADKVMVVDPERHTIRAVGGRKVGTFMSRRRSRTEQLLALAESEHAVLRYAAATPTSLVLVFGAADATARVCGVDLSPTVSLVPRSDNIKRYVTRPSVLVNGAVFAEVREIIPVPSGCKPLRLQKQGMSDIASSVRDRMPGCAARLRELDCPLPYDRPSDLQASAELFLRRHGVSMRVARSVAVRLAYGHDGVDTDLSALEARVTDSSPRTGVDLVKAMAAELAVNPTATVVTAVTKLSAVGYSLLNGGIRLDLPPPPDRAA